MRSRGGSGAAGLTAVDDVVEHIRGPALPLGEQRTLVDERRPVVHADRLQRRGESLGELVHLGLALGVGRALRRPAQPVHGAAWHPARQQELAELRTIQMVMHRPRAAAVSSGANSRALVRNAGCPRVLTGRTSAAACRSWPMRLLKSSAASGALLPSGPPSSCGFVP